jgi:hypothetical protein
MTTLLPKRALIFGSCVSRDLTRIDSERFETFHYTARQSWISAYSASTTPPEIKLFSAFQKRMIENDYKSSGSTVLSSTRPSKSDVIILDLIDERLGVIPYKNTWITYSNELEKTGLVTSAQLEKRIDFGSDRHFSVWKKSAQKFREVLDPHMDKVFLIAAKFAETTNLGSPILDFRGLPAEKWNSMYDQYYNELIRLGFNAIPHPADLVIANEEHLWGPTAFHYVDQAYTSFGDHIINGLHAI